MYLAHEISILGSHYESELQAGIPMTFVDLVPEVKKLGAEAFLSQMRHQRQQLLQLIQEQGKRLLWCFCWKIILLSIKSTVLLILQTLKAHLRLAC